MAVCANAPCGASLEGKRRDAIYCSRTCKTAASDARRKEDGRAQARDRARYAREADHRRAYAKEYLRRNPEKMRAIRRNRRSRVKTSRLLVTERDWTRLVARFRGCCAYCGARSKLQREHVIPVAAGGRHAIGNLLPSCSPCNYRKRTKFLSAWRYLDGGAPALSHRREVSTP